MFIKEITLSNFLSYGKECRIELGAINVIIGTNGSGKSNLVEALGLLQAAPVDFLRPISDGGGIQDWLWKGEASRNGSFRRDGSLVRDDGRASQATVDAVFEHRTAGGQDLRYVLSFGASPQERFELRDERVEDAAPRYGETDAYFYYRFQGGRPYINVANAERDRPRQLQSESVDFEKSILAQRRDIDLYPEITWLGNQLPTIAIYRDWRFGRDAPPRLPQRADMPNLRLENDCSNLGLVLNKLFRQAPTKKHVMEMLQEVNSGIQDCFFNVEGGTIQLFIQENDMNIPTMRLSEGTLRFLCLLAVLCDSKPAPLVCIEEPEIGVHPDIVPVVAQLIKEASERTQLIVTTHSDLLVDCFSDMPESVVVAEKDAGGTSLRHLDAERLETWLKAYRKDGLGELWLAGELGGTRW